jgi:hypothetical protein
MWIITLEPVSSAGVLLLLMLLLLEEAREVKPVEPTKRNR